MYGDVQQAASVLRGGRLGEAENGQLVHLIIAELADRQRRWRPGSAGSSRGSWLDRWPTPGVGACRAASQSLYRQVDSAAQHGEYHRDEHGEQDARTVTGPDTAGMPVHPRIVPAGARWCGSGSCIQSPCVASSAAAAASPQSSGESLMKSSLRLDSLQFLCRFRTRSELLWFGTPVAGRLACRNDIRP